MNDPFEGEELSSLQLLVNSLNASCPAQEFVCCDNDLEVCSGLVDPSDPEWRTKVREDVLVQNDQDPKIPARRNWCESAVWMTRKRRHWK